MLKKAIFLDRDGVLNKAIIKNGKPYPPASLVELEISQDVLPALKTLKSQGYLLIGVTNQPDVARGKTSRQLVEMINQKLMEILPLNEIRVCYHDDQDGCKCRKPLPGLIHQAAKEYGIHLSNSIMIGDRWKDIEAGQRAGCKTVWLDCSYQEPAPKNLPDFIASTFAEVCDWILNTHLNERKTS